jgi:hypothetical protein
MTNLISREEGLRILSRAKDTFAVPRLWGHTKTLGSGRNIQQGGK